MAVMQKLVFPMRDTMPHFVSSLRTVDEWKRMHAKRADAITQAEYDANAKYVKSPFAKSLKVEDLHRFLEDSVLDINFMVQLPSIEKCLEQWWELYAHEHKWVDQDQLRTMYYDLAYVLVEAKTENIHKNAVSMILRSSWTKWSPKDPPLRQAEFYRLLFVLGHLMTLTNRMDEYVTFFQETIAKIRRLYQSKAVRMQMRQHQPKARRKQSIVSVSGNYDDAASLQFLNSSGNSTHHSHTLQIPSYHPPSPESPPNQSVVSSGLVCLPAHDVRVSVADDQTPDRFVELLDRNSRCQHIVVDPLLHDKRFQEKWKLPTNVDSSLVSSNDLAIAQNPRTNRYFPPLLVSRVRTGAAAWDCCSSTPAIKYKPTESQHNTNKHQHARTDGDSSLHRSQSLTSMLKNASQRLESNDDEEILRRSLSRVTLKQRIEQNKKRQQHNANTATPEDHKRSSDTREQRQGPIYLAIST